MDAVLFSSSFFINFNFDFSKCPAIISSSNCGRLMTKRTGSEAMDRCKLYKAVLIAMIVDVKNPLRSCQKIRCILYYKFKYNSGCQYLLTQPQYEHISSPFGLNF
jgi:hypothetical protein